MVEGRHPRIRSDNRITTNRQRSYTPSLMVGAHAAPTQSVGQHTTHRRWELLTWWVSATAC